MVHRLARYSAFPRLAFALAVIAGCASRLDLDPAGDDQGALGSAGDAAADANADGSAVVSRGLVIRQVYASGGVEGSTFKKDFIEFFNPTEADISLSGLSLQVAAAGDAFLKIPTTDAGIGTTIVPLPPTKPVPAHRSLTMTLAREQTASADILGDLESSKTVLPAAGKVALAKGPKELKCGTADNRCVSDRIIDLVGWGEGVSDYEGSGPAEAGAPTLAVQRLGGGCLDTGHNVVDFLPATPTFRTSNDRGHYCVEDGGIGDAEPPPPSADPPDSSWLLPPRDAAPRDARARDADDLDDQQPPPAAADAANALAAPPGPQPTCSAAPPAGGTSVFPALGVLFAIAGGLRRRSALPPSSKRDAHVLPRIP